MADSVEAAIKLRNCVDEVNQGGWFAPSEITFEGPQTYLLDKPLILERDVVIRAKEQVLTASPSFAGDSVLIVGTPCPGSSCAGTIDVTIHEMEFDGSGSTNLRGIDLRPQHNLVLDAVHLHDFTTADAGGGVRAQQQSNVTLLDGLIEKCTAATSGGGLFTESIVTIVSGTAFDENEALLGGGVYLGDSGTFSRKLRIWDASFKENLADNGGGLMTAEGATNTQVAGSTFEINDAVDRGGAFYGGGRLLHSSFVGNTAGQHGGGALLRTESFVFGSTFDSNEAWRGAGISVLAIGNFDMDIAHSTISNNVSNVFMGSNPRLGAGIYIGRGVNPPTTGITYVRNSTISGNVMDPVSPNAQGGGLALSGVAAVVEHVTFSENDAQFARALYTSPNSRSDLTLQSSILANAPDPANPNPGPVCVLGPTFQTTTSLDTDGSCGVAQSSVDPVLGPLQDNGGDTFTHLPSASAVLGTASCFAGYDQRGLPRPSSGCDIGSVEQ